MHPRITLSTENFFFGLSVSISGYILLPYLAGFMSAEYTGLVLAAGSALSCLGFFSLPRLINRLGAQQSAILLSIAQVFALFALATNPNIFFIIALVVITTALQPFLVYMFDVLVEATVSQEGVTGRVRTLFLTAWNAAELGSPLLMGALLANGERYDLVFLAAAAALMPTIVLLAARKLPREAHLALPRIRDTLRAVATNRDLAAVITARFILGIFYAWAIFYVPLYLHNTLGIAWVQLGWIFSVILIPFILIEYPSGYIADRFLGDKELMVAGFIITGISFAMLSVVGAGSSIWLIFLILLVTRIGASLIESMTESHFFRRVSSGDSEDIAAYRVTWPLTNLVGPLIGTGLLLVTDYSGFFLWTGLFILVGGVLAALSIRDFR